MNKNINIPGRLHSVVSDSIATGANEVYDDILGKSQQQINSELIARIEALEGNG